MTNSEPSGFRIPDALSVELTFSLTITSYLTKTENKNKKHSSHTIALSKGPILIKNANKGPDKGPIFTKKMLTSAKLRGSCYYKVYFLKLHMLELRTKFHVSSIILTSFRHWVILIHHRKMNP